MTVSIKSGKVRLKLWLPLSALKLASKFASKAAKYDDDAEQWIALLSGSSGKELYASLKQAKKTYPKLEIVRVEAADGTRVLIKL